MMDFYEATVGPYPFADEKMGVVETPHLGMEHQTINAYGNAYRLDGKGYDWLLHHELAHEWFGNQMTNRNADDMWLHEGLGSYMQPLYLRWLHGERYMQAELQEQRRDLINRFPVVSGADRSEDEVYKNDIGPGLDLYNKGSLIAHSLRMLIGDEAFFRSLTRLVYGTSDPRPGNFTTRYGTTDEFLAITSEEGGRDLTWFFRGYLYQAALPDLRQTRGNGELSLHSLRMLIGDAAFFRSVTRLVYGTADPRPGNFTTRYGTTDEFLALVSEEAGRDLTWFFRGYLYQAALPDLRQTREDGELSLEWVTGDGGVFPMPVEVEIDGRRQTVAMTGGRGAIPVAAGAHVLIDPDNKVLRRDVFLEEWKAAGGR